MFRKAVFELGGLVLLFSALAAMGQPSDAAFWQTPGNTVRDAKGNITYTQIKDPKNFTMKIFDRGQWVTYHYEPSSTKVAKVEGPDTSEDYLYDGENWNGLVVRAHGRTHTIHATDTTATADDMPAITVERDSRGRDIAVRRGAEVVAAVSYDTAGQVRRLTIGTMLLDFSIQADGIHEVLTANGAVLITTVAKGKGKRQFPVSLDPVADRLGLGPDWRNTVRVKGSATGSLLSVSDGPSRPIAEMVQLGPMFAAFDSKGASMFYDLRLNYSAFLERGEGDTGPDPTTALIDVFPNRLIVPVTGNASAYVSSPADGSIASLWTSPGSTSAIRFVVYRESAKPRAAILQSTPVTSPAAAGSVIAHSRHWTTAPLMMWQCGTQESWSCDSSGGSGYCFDYYTPVYCDSGGGGAYDPPPGDSGGGSPGTGTGNQINSDPPLRMAVNNALNAAAGKFGNTRCSQDLFKDTKLTGGTTSLADVLAQSGNDPASWLASTLTYVNGFTNGSCADHPAFTTPNNKTVTVCSSFKNLGPSQGAVVLIHEELHTLGLTERPGYPDAAMDSAQITQLVMDYCDG